MGACATACLYWSGPAPAPAPSPRPARRARHGPHAGERHGSDRHQGFVGKHGPRPRGDVRHHGRRARGGLATLAVFPSRASDATHPVPARHTRQGRAAGSPECGEGTGVVEKGHVKRKARQEIGGLCGCGRARIAWVTSPDNSGHFLRRKDLPDHPEHRLLLPATNDRNPGTERQGKLPKAIGGTRYRPPRAGTVCSRFPV